MAAASSSSSTVVIFDFDKTIIDVDSDNWVIENLGATQLFQTLLPTMPWNSLMDMMMKEFHSQGITVEDIAKCLKRIPLDPHVISAIKSARELGCDLRVVSDANMFYIETILEHHGVLGCFTEINTNPSYVDEEGKIRISPYHDFTASPHGCNLCPPNMCKGKIIERIRTSQSVEGKKRFIYLGDGKGDYCPSLKLSEGDYVMPRKNYPVWDLITSNIGLIKAKVYEWSNGEELERILLQLIKRTISKDCSNSDQLLSADCKSKTLPAASSREALPKPLPIFQ
ncbi:inorganic pyrophosphatase 1-like [Iris pallida]|uniref:Inorganic pyrophosphatase 1-like n=1 Tax=Iris pallida TaxID=29817 RepID=A0AAX6FEX0_IRIPA|nr:inorganic pyrophosphatase 1-like [Iris pallida]